MLWIALRLPALNDDPDPACTSPHDPHALSPEQQALSWWALQFSPRVCTVEEAVLLEAEDYRRRSVGEPGWYLQGIYG